jgi:hypothetical protein
MAKIDNSNYNKISVKTDSTVKLIETLKDLGVFKEKRKNRPRTTSGKTPLRSESTGKAYTEQIRVQPDTQLTDSEKEDINNKTNALIAQIRDEVAQNRIEDLQKTGQALFTLFSSIPQRINRPEQQQSFDPFERKEEVYLLPDTEEREFSKTPSQGAPEVQSEKQETIFPATQRKRSIFEKRKAYTDKFGLSPLPNPNDVSTKDMLEYYTEFINTTNETFNNKITTSKKKMFDEMLGFINIEETVIEGF